MEDEITAHMPRENEMICAGDSVVDIAKRRKTAAPGQSGDGGRGPLTSPRIKAPTDAATNAARSPLIPEAKGVLLIW